MSSDRDPRRIAIGARIAAARAKKSLSQFQLALRLSVTPGAVAQWERGYTLPKITHFDELPEILGVSREWLLTGNDSQQVLTAQTKAEEVILRLARALTGEQQALLIKMLAGLADSDTPKSE